jgi:hypothetical protein
MERSLREASDPSTPAARLLVLAAEHPELLGAVVQNPAAPPEWLESLAKHKEPAVRRAITQNPNTPLKGLLMTGAEFPGELLANPAFALFFLESPSLMHQVNDYLLSQLARFAEIPQLLLQRASRGQEHSRRGAAKNPALPEEILFRLGGDELFEIRKDILLRPWRSPARLLLERLGISAEQQAPTPTDATLTTHELAQLCESGGFARWLVTSHPNVTAELLERLSEEHSVAVLAGVARNAKTPAHVVARLTMRYELLIRVALLENPNLPAVTVQELASRPNTEHALKIVLAGRPELTPTQLDAFAKSGRIAIRAAVAQNPSSSASLLASLCHDKSHTVRALVAQQAKITPESVAVLAQDPLAVVRLYVAKRPALAPALIELLCGDASPRVRACLAARYDTPPALLCQLLLSPYREVFQAALQNAQTPRDFCALVVRVRERQPLTEEELARFFGLGDDAKVLLAAHPQIPRDFLKELIDARSHPLCLAAAQSPNADYSLLRPLLEDPSEEVRVVAAKRLSSCEVPEGLSAPSSSTQSLPAWLQQRLQKSLQRQQEQRAARDPDTPPEALEALAKKNEKELLRLLASRKDLPPQALRWFRGRFTRKLLENPEFSARLLREPEAFYQLPIGVLQGALSQPQIPPEFLRWAVEHPSMEVRHAVAGNPRATPALLRQLAQTKDSGFSLRRLIAQHPNTPEELLSTFLSSHDPWLKIWAERALLQRKRP